MHFEYMYMYRPTPESNLLTEEALHAHYKISHVNYENFPHGADFFMRISWLLSWLRHAKFYVELKPRVPFLYLQVPTMGPYLWSVEYMCLHDHTPFLQDIVQYYSSP